MKVSLNTIKQLTGIELPPVDELVERINQQLGGVEEIIDFGAKYKDAQIVRVAECEKHPNADKLWLCQIDAGTGELIQVVCGANNVKKDMWAVWLPPESTVPSTFDDAEPFVLSARELRGKLSNGMLASARELALGDDHDGIIEITETDLPSMVNIDMIQAGQSFAETFGLDDTIIDIENKMFTHRPDLFGQLGVAREIAGIFGQPFSEPTWYNELADMQVASESFELQAFNEAGDKVPRLMLVGLDDVTVKDSPLWLKAELVTMGGKPINNVVDITNYVMLTTAQPLHAYDYDKLRGGAVGARVAQAGEKVTLLNDKTYQLADEDIVIVDGQGPIGLAGVMGGGESEVSAETRRIVLECATFDMYTVRKTSMRYGLFTDAVTRFTKGQSPLVNQFVTQQAIRLLNQLTGAQLATPLYDDIKVNGQWRTQPAVMPMTEPRTIEAKFINDRLGLALSAQQIADLLDNVGFDCRLDGTAFSYQAPAWRMDIQDPEDVVEEVGRLYGFDNLPRQLPERTISPAPRNHMRVIKQKLRDSLSKAGASEVLTYSFVHQNTLKKATQDAEQAFRLSNALSPDLQYYRLTVLPSLLERVHPNIKAGHDEFTLYEIGKGHNKKYHQDDDDGLPKELQFVDAVYASKKSQAGAAYYRMRRLLDQLASDHQLELVYQPAEAMIDDPVSAPFELSRSALVQTKDGQTIGLVGELKQSVIRSFKLPAYTAAMTLDLELIAATATTSHQLYKPLSRYPSLWQDLSLRVGASVSYAEVYETVRQAVDEQADQAEIKIEPVTIYQPADDPSTRTITLRLEAVSHERTLTDDDLKPVVEHAVSQAAQRHDAQLT